METNKEITKEGRIHDPEAYGKSEIIRVTNAIADAEKRLSDLQQSRLYTPNKKQKIGELMIAVKYGKKYLESLKKRWLN